MILQAKHERLYIAFYAALPHSIQQPEFKLKQAKPHIIQIQRQPQK